MRDRIPCKCFIYISLLCDSLSVTAFSQTGVVGPVIATHVAAFSNQIDDNLSVPLVVGLFAHLAMRMI